MDLSLSEEQSILRDSLSSFLSEKYTFERRRALLSRQAGSSADDIWRAFATDLGILGASFPEELGGIGGGAVETMIIMEELGRSLVLEPYLETVVIAGGFLRRSGSPFAKELIGRIIQGEARVAFAYAEPQARYCWHDVATEARRGGGGHVLNGHKSVVIGAPEAATLIVTARTGGDRRDRNGLSLFAVDARAKGVERRDYRTIDGGSASEIHFEDVDLGPEAVLTVEGEAWPLIEQVVDEATAAICAEASGVLRRLLDETVAYTKQRRQFGVPIASFQVLQHRMVDMLIAAEQAASITLMATLKLDGDPSERARAVSAAKAKVGEACRFVGQNAIQLHGGMGVTDELAVSHYFKRATRIESQFGSTDHHLARYTRLSFAEQAAEDPALAA